MNAPRLDLTAIDWLTDCVLDHVTRVETVETVEPVAIAFLLRRYATTGRMDVAEALGRTLARAIDLSLESLEDQVEWVNVLADAAALSDDPRVSRAAASLVARCRAGWRTAVSLAETMHSVDAALRAFDTLENPGDLLAEAIETLERLVGAAYRPGHGMAHQADGFDTSGQLDVQLRSASALLTAFAKTGRLPYSMLAEELMQRVLKEFRDECDGGLYQQSGQTSAAKPFALNCIASRIFCRLVVLHQDEGYRQRAIVASGSDYAHEAARTLASQTPGLRRLGAAAAPYGLALVEWLGLQSAA